MAKDRAMLEVPSVGVGGGGGGEDDEIELSLGLSIGRSYKRSKGSSALERDSTNSCFSVGDFGPEGGEDSQSKRLVQALRRREARMKRDEKLKKAEIGGICQAEKGNGEDFVVAEPARKKGKTGIADEMVGSDEDRSDLSLALNRCQNPVSDMTSFGVSSPVIPVLVPPPLQYQYPPMQFMPFTSGFVYPQMQYMAPWWAAAAGGYPEACRPYQGNWENNNAAKNGLADEKAAGSVGSPKCSSSSVSDYQSSSNQGGNSSDTRSMSSHSHQEYQHRIASAASSPPRSATNQVESSETIHKLPTHTSKLASSSIQGQSSLLKLCDGSKPNTPPDSVNKETVTPQSPKAQNRSIVKPTGPTTETRGTMASLPQMPCVSTTGNGPNGKTVTGILYRYTNAAVSIVCVCHGSSFTPAEFVEHAGGVNISHPLRHITVVPSAFGC